MAVRARSGSGPTAIGELARTLPYVGLNVLMPAGVLIVVTGVWMVLASTVWKFSHPWVLLALVLFALAFTLGAVYLSRVGIRLGRTASAQGAGEPEAVSLVNHWLVGCGVVLVLLLIAVWDKVFEPGL